MKLSTFQLGKFDFSKIKRKITNQINIAREQGDLDQSPRNSPRGLDRSDEGLATNKRDRRATDNSAGLSTSKKEKERRGTGSPRSNAKEPHRDSSRDSPEVPTLRSSGNLHGSDGSEDKGTASGASGPFSPRNKERRNAQGDIWSLSPRGSDAPLSPRGRGDNADSPRMSPRIGKPQMLPSQSSPNLTLKSDPNSDTATSKEASPINKTQPLFRKPSNNNFRVNISSLDGNEFEARSPRDNAFLTTPRSPRLEMSSNRHRFASEGTMEINLNDSTNSLPEESKHVPGNTPSFKIDTALERPYVPLEKDKSCAPNTNEAESSLAPENIKVLSPRAVRITKPEGGARARFCSDGHYDELESGIAAVNNRHIRSPRSPRRLNDSDSVRATVRVREVPMPSANIEVASSELVNLAEQTDD